MVGGVGYVWQNCNRLNSAAVGRRQVQYVTAVIGTSSTDGQIQLQRSRRIHHIVSRTAFDCGIGNGRADHIHMHALPRWAADSNFATVIAETRVLPEALEVTWERAKAEFERP